MTYVIITDTPMSDAHKCLATSLRKDEEDQARGRTYSMSVHRKTGRDLYQLVVFNTTSQGIFLKLGLMSRRTMENFVEWLRYDVFKEGVTSAKVALRELTDGDPDSARKDTMQIVRVEEDSGVVNYHISPAN